MQSAVRKVQNENGENGLGDMKPRKGLPSREVHLSPENGHLSGIWTSSRIYFASQVYRVFLWETVSSPSIIR